MVGGDGACAVRTGSGPLLMRGDDDDPFIVLTETKFSIRYIPVWARYSSLRTRVEAALTMTLLVHW